MNSLMSFKCTLNIDGDEYAVLSVNASAAINSIPTLTCNVLALDNTLINLTDAVNSYSGLMAKATDPLTNPSKCSLTVTCTEGDKDFTPINVSEWILQDVSISTSASIISVNVVIQHPVFLMTLAPIVLSLGRLPKQLRLETKSDDIVSIFTSVVRQILTTSSGSFSSDSNLNEAFKALAKRSKDVIESNQDGKLIKFTDDAGHKVPGGVKALAQIIANQLGASFISDRSSLFSALVQQVTASNTQMAGTFTDDPIIVSPIAPWSDLPTGDGYDIDIRYITSLQSTSGDPLQVNSVYVADSRKKDLDDTTSLFQNGFTQAAADDLTTGVLGGYFDLAKHVTGKPLEVPLPLWYTRASTGRGNLTKLFPDITTDPAINLSVSKSLVEDWTHDLFHGLFRNNNNVVVTTAIFDSKLKVGHPVNVIGVDGDVMIKGVISSITLQLSANNMVATTQYVISYVRTSDDISKIKSMTNIKNKTYNYEPKG